MKQCMCVFFAVAIALSLWGCEPQVSLFPLYTPQETLFDAQLLGEWEIWSGKEPKPDQSGSIAFSKGQEAYTYEVKIPNFNEKKATLYTTGRLVKLGNSLFIDFGTPTMDNLPLIPYPVLGGHIFGRLLLAKDKAEIDLLNDEWTKNAVKAGNMPLAFHDAESGIVLAAETAELRKFALDHAEDDAAFSEVYSLARKSTSR